MNSYKLEIACFDLESALTAQKGGADRIELCDDLSSGGITPQPETVKQARANILIPLYVMIRPRGGNFCYTEEEFMQMKRSIEIFKKAGVDGFVFGILNEDLSVDLQRNKELVKLASPLPCSFHRAFDKVPEMEVALDEVISCGFKTILTSGLSASAPEGLPMLKRMVEKAGDKICIMPGGGVRSSNIERIMKETGAAFYHSSAITTGKKADINEVKALKEKLN